MLFPGGVLSDPLLVKLKLLRCKIWKSAFDLSVSAISGTICDVWYFTVSATGTNFKMEAAKAAHEGRSRYVA